MNELNVRIKHKYDTYANWLTSKIILEAGELAIAEIPSQQTFEEPYGSTVLTPPAIGVKVGNGLHTFKELPWIQSTAGDVYAWAKEAEKPIYTAEEIENLEDYIAGKVEDTNTSYRFIYENDALYIFEYNLGQDIPEELVPDDATYIVPITVSTKVDKVESVENIEGNIVLLTEDGNIKDSGTHLETFLSEYEDFKSSYNEFEESVSSITTGIEDRLQTTEGQVEELITSVDILNGDGEGSVQKQVADAIASVVAGAPENLDTLKEIANVIEGGFDNGAAGLITRVDDIEDKIESLETDTISPMLDSITANENNIQELQGKTSSIEEILGDSETAGLIKDVFDNTNDISNVKEILENETTGLVNRVNIIEEDLETITEEISNVRDAVQTISISGMTEEDEAVTKDGTNIEINKIPVSILVDDITLILNCGNATEVI